VGKGLTEMRSPQREHCPNMLDRNYNANLTAGDSEVRRTFLIAEASISEEPGAVIPLAGICAGGAG
jgi:hypothetical protein